jgi:SAM-dependent methyltransferase
VVSADYQLTDSDLAARRLEYLARVYEPSSADFIRSAVAGRPRPRRAVDLGCGPGHTTLLLAACTRSDETCGLDQSEAFVRLAEARCAGRAAFRVHDVTVVPFPVGPADVLYCRLLLSHVQEPGRLFDSWGVQTVPGGLLLLEEVEWIETDDPVFRDYLQKVDALLASQGQRLYVGPLLREAGSPGVWQRLVSEVQPIEVEASQAATMFWMNIQSWRQQPFARGTWSVAVLDALERALFEGANGREAAGPIRWGFRRCVLKRS